MTRHCNNQTDRFRCGGPGGRPTDTIERKIEDTRKNITALEDINRSYGGDIKGYEARCDNIQKQIDDIAKSSGTESVDIKEIYQMNPGSLSASSEWKRFVSGDAVAEAHTDVDGKYSVEVPGGHYYAYARNDSANSTVEWLIPVNVIDSKNISIDFHNETAISIKNKTD